MKENKLEKAIKKYSDELYKKFPDLLRKYINFETLTYNDDKIILDDWFTLEELEGIVSCIRKIKMIKYSQKIDTIGVRKNE